MNAEALTAALGGRWFGRYGTAKCPAHPDKKPSLSISAGDKAPLLKCFAGCETASVLDALRARGLWSGTPSDAPPIDLVARERERAAEIERRRVAAFRIWKKTKPASGTVVETYLRNRGISLPVPGALRFHADLRHTGTGQDLPAMVAVVTGPDDRFRGIQRTFLTANGRKAPVTDPKMGYGPIAGGAVRLSRPAQRLGLAEGIETALSAAMLYRVSVWATLGTSGLVDVVLPDEVREVLIFADRGEAGQSAADRAGARFVREGRKASRHTPDAPHSDFNDLICAELARGAAQ